MNASHLSGPKKLQKRPSLSRGIFVSQNQSCFPKLAPRLHKFLTENSPYAADRGCRLWRHKVGWILLRYKKNAFVMFWNQLIVVGA